MKEIMVMSVPILRFNDMVLLNIVYECYCKATIGLKLIILRGMVFQAKITYKQMNENMIF